MIIKIRMPSFYFKLLLLAGLLWSWQTHTPLLAEAAPVSAPHIQVELVSPQTVIRPGQYFEVGLYQKMEKNWHTYWVNPGDSGQATRIQWLHPEGFKTGNIMWPIPQKIQVGPLVNYGYKDEVLLITRVRAPDNLPLNQDLIIEAKAKWLICEKVCIPGKAHLSLKLRSASQSQDHPLWKGFFQLAKQQIPKKQYGIKTQLSSSDTKQWRLRVYYPPKGWPMESPFSLPEFFQQKELQLFPINESVMENNGSLRIERNDKHLDFFFQKNQFLKAKDSYFHTLISDGKKAVEIRSSFPQTSQQSASWLLAGQALLFALLGGLILNLMPCVFPVLSIKALGLVQKTQKDSSFIRIHGLVFLSGVLASFTVLAGLLLLLRSAGEQLGWGFQLQSPTFIFSLILILFVMGLSLSGLFEVGGRLMGMGGKLSQKEGYAGSFFTGVLAVVVATPCTAPFMGTALGIALSQPAWMALLIFNFLGLGMALPYLLLTFFPQWIQRLPKPGTWMVTLKELLAFPLYATVIWLLWVLSLQAGSDAVVSTLIVLLVFSFGLWIYQRNQNTHEPRRLITHLAVLALLCWSAVYTAINIQSQQQQYLQKRSSPSSQNVQSQYGLFKAVPYSKKKLKQYLDEGRWVFINFTAAWCITCKANEKVSLSLRRSKNSFRPQKSGLHGSRLD